jgi:hypothetical protein
MVKGTITGFLCTFLGLNKFMQRDIKICEFGRKFLVTTVLINLSRSCYLMDSDHSAFNFPNSLFRSR